MVCNIPVIRHMFNAAQIRMTTTKSPGQSSKHVAKLKVSTSDPQLKGETSKLAIYSSSDQVSSQRTRPKLQMPVLHPP